MSDHWRALAKDERTEKRMSMMLTGILMFIVYILLKTG
jgi:hypothetical protein